MCIPFYFIRWNKFNIMLDFCSLVRLAYSDASEIWFLPILTTLQTDCLTKPPIRSIAPLHWDVAKKFHVIFHLNSISHTWRFENKKCCLNCEVQSNLHNTTTLLSTQKRLSWTGCIKKHLYKTTNQMRSRFSVFIRTMNFL